MCPPWAVQVLPGGWVAQGFSSPPNPTRAKQGFSSHVFSSKWAFDNHCSKAEDEPKTWHGYYCNYAGL